MGVGSSQVKEDLTASFLEKVVDDEDNAPGNDEASATTFTELRRRKVAKITTWSDLPLRVWDGPHIIAYNAKKLTTYDFLVRTGTVFDIRHRWIWIQVVILLAVMALASWCACSEVVLEYWEGN